MSAALTFGRARHTTLIVHSGLPRNGLAAHGNGFLAHDGGNPMELLKTSYEQVKKYEATVKLHEGRVTKLAKSNKDGEPTQFTATLDDGTEVVSKRVLLATGVEDKLPEIQGLKEIWGKRAHICPYCDAFEYKSIAVLATSPMAEHLGNMLRTQWSEEVTLFASPEWLAGNEKTPAPVMVPNLKVLPAASSVKWSGNEEDEVEIFGADGEKLASAQAIFAPSAWIPQSQLAKELGADLHPMGFVFVDTEYQSSVPGLSAVGDVAWFKDGKIPVARVAEAVGSGARAAGWLSSNLIREKVAALTGAPAH